VDVDGDEWGMAPMPPAPPIDAPSQPSAGIKELGPPPESDAARASWLYRLLTTQAYEVAIDPNISEATRRKEVRVIAGAAAKHYPDAARFELAQKIDADKAELETRKRAKAAAKLERLPAAGGAAKVIPIRGDA
jgi:hypothetical protein